MRSTTFLSIIAIALAGCESTVTDGDGDVGGGGGSSSTCGACQPGECPANQPTAGDPCDTNLECEYTEVHGTECDEYSMDVTFVCYGLQWVELSNHCSEYEPECPSELPLAGSYCGSADADAGVCVYDLQSPCEPSPTAEAVCDLASGWQVTMPEGYCAECYYVTAEECAATGACRWLTPPCDSLEPFEPFCAPNIDCAAGGCSGEEICIDVAVNDCWASPSDPTCCEGTAGVCEAPPPGED